MGRWEKICVGLFILIAAVALTIAAKAQFLQCKPECGSLANNSRNDDWCANNLIDSPSCADSWLPVGEPATDYKITDAASLRYIAPTVTGSDDGGTFVANPGTFKVHDRGWVAACGTFTNATYTLSLLTRTTDINPVIYTAVGLSPPAVPEVTDAIVPSASAVPGWNRSDAFASQADFIKYIREDDDENIAVTRKTYALDGINCFWFLPVNTKIYGLVLMNNESDRETDVFGTPVASDYEVLEAGALVPAPSLTDNTCSDPAWGGAGALPATNIDAAFHATGNEVRMIWKDNPSGDDTLFLRYKATDDMVVDESTANEVTTNYANDAVILLAADAVTHVADENTCKVVATANGYYTDYKFPGHERDSALGCVTAIQKATDVTDGYCVEVQMAIPAATAGSLRTMALMYFDKLVAGGGAHKAVPFGLTSVGAAIDDLSQSTAFDAEMSATTIDVDIVAPTFPDATDCTATATTTDASISCKVSEDSSCVLDYGTAPGGLTSHTTPVNSQLIGGFNWCIASLTGLTEATTYYYRMNAEDRAEDPNTGTTAELNFTTQTTPEAPTVTLAALTDLSDTGVTVNFNSNLPADCEVSYDLDDDDVVSEPEWDPDADPPQPEEWFDMTTTGLIDCNGDCSITLVSLNPETLYEYQVSCTLKDGTLTGFSTVDQFTTLAPPNIFKRAQTRDWNLMCYWDGAEPVVTGSTADNDIIKLSYENLSEVPPKKGHCDGFTFPWKYQKATVAKGAAGSTVEWVFAQFDLGGLDATIDSPRSHDTDFFIANVFESGGAVKPRPEWQLKTVNGTACTGTRLYIKSTAATGGRTAALMDYGSIGTGAELDTTKYVDAWLSEVIANKDALAVEGIWGGQCRPWVSSQYVTLVNESACLSGTGSCSVGAAALPCNPRKAGQPNPAYTMDEWNTDWLNALKRIKTFFDANNIFFTCNTIGAWWKEYNTPFLYDADVLGPNPAVSTDLKEAANNIHAIEIEDFAVGFSINLSADQWIAQMDRLDDMLLNKVAVPIVYQSRGKTSTEVEFFREASYQMARPLATTLSMLLMHPVPGYGVGQVSSWWDRVGEIDTALGYPDGNRYQLGGTVLWRRDFQNGFVVVNPTTTANVSFDIGGTYTDGSPKKYYRVKANMAEVTGTFIMGANAGEIFILKPQAEDTTPPDFTDATECTTSGTSTTITSIKCKISEVSDCKALYSTTSGLPTPTETAWVRSITGTDGVQYCSLDLSGLTPSTTYYYKVTARDISPRQNTSTTDNQYSFTTADAPTAPTTTWVRTAQNTPTSQDVTIQVDQAAKCQIKYEAGSDGIIGVATYFPVAIPDNNNCQANTDCVFTVTGLSAAQAYDAAGTCTNANGSDESPVNNFTTKANPASPNVTLRAISGVTSSGATVNYTVTVDSSTSISGCTAEYKAVETSDCGSLTGGSTKDGSCPNAGQCSIALTGLNASQTYDYKVNCTDRNDNTDATPPCNTFDTIAPTPSPSPPPPTAGCPDPPQKAGGNTYYISPTGNDSASGGSGTPWKTFNSALPKLRPGDTLIVKKGVWTNFLTCAEATKANYPYFKDWPPGADCYANAGQPTFRAVCGSTDGPVSGESDNWIHIKAEEERKAMIIGNGTNLGQGNYRGSNLYMENCRYWQIEGLRGTMASRSDAQTYNGDTGATIHNFHVQYSSNLVFCRNIVHHNNHGNNGSHLYQMGPDVDNSLFLENEAWDFTRHGIAITSGGSYNVVRRNYTNGAPGRWPFPGTTAATSYQCGEGIAFYGAPANIMENNVNEGCDATSVARETPANNVGVGNLDYVSSSQGIFSHNRWEIHGHQNTLIADNVSLKNQKGRYGGFFQQGEKGVQLYNNSSFGNTANGYFGSGRPGDGAYKDYNMSIYSDTLLDKCMNPASGRKKSREDCCKLYDCNSRVADRNDPRGHYPDQTPIDATKTSDDYKLCPHLPNCHLEAGWPPSKHWDVRSDYYNANGLAVDNDMYGFGLSQPPHPGWWMVEKGNMSTNDLGLFGYQAQSEGSWVAKTDIQCKPAEELNSTEFYGLKCYATPTYGAWPANYPPLSLKSEGCCFKDMQTATPTKMWRQGTGQGCLVYIPGGYGGGVAPNGASTLAKQGISWGFPGETARPRDIGANVIYRYETPVGQAPGVGRRNPVLTNVSLWNKSDGSFPCGAPVDGVNYNITFAAPGGAAGHSCYNVHRRFNVGYNGCPHPLTGELY